MGLYVFIFVTVALGVGACCYLVHHLLSPERSLLRRRLDNEFGRPAEDHDQGVELFKDLDALDVDGGPPSGVNLDYAAVSGVNLVPRHAARASRSLRTRLQMALEQTGVTLTVRQLIWLMIGLGLVLGVGGAYLAGPLGGIAAAAVGAAAPMVYLRQQLLARRHRLLAQLPNAFDLMARVLRAGYPVPQALQAVADTFEPPIAEEFANCQKQQNLGLKPEITFHELAQRTAILEMRIFVMAMLIQRQTGGNLADVLERLAGLVRARFRLRNHVRSLTAEGRMQGLVLLILPFVLFAAMMVVNRQYAQILFEHVPLLVGMGVSMVVGALWIRRIVSFDV